MPLKPKSNVTPTPPAQAMTEERMLRINPEVNNRLDGFIQANPKMADYYTSLVKEHPERAVRSFMLGKMFRHEAEMRQTARQAPQAKEWLDQQEPTLKQKIMTGSKRSIRSTAKGSRARDHPREDQDRFHPTSITRPGNVSLIARHEGRARREKSPAVPPLALGFPNCPEKAAKAPPSSAVRSITFESQ